MVSIVQLFLILVALGLFISAKAVPVLISGGFILIVIALLVGWAAQRRPFRRTRLDGPLALLLLSGLVGLWASYDFQTSLTKFGLILGGVALYYALSQSRLQVRLTIAAGVVGGAAVLALFFITQNNAIFEAGAAAKFPLLGSLSATLRGVSPQLGLYEFHPNVVAGVLEVALLVGIGLLLILRRANTNVLPLPRSLLLTILNIALGLIVLGLLLTGSRGAWFATTLAGLGWVIASMQRASRLRLLDGLAVLLIIGSLLALFFFQVDRTILATDGGGVSRLTLYRGASHLVGDYLFTGAGLGTFPMLYSAYVLGIEVVQLTHPHNLYLAAWLEQGLLGIIALVWLGVAVALAYRRWQMPQSTTTSPDSDPTRRLLAAASFWAVTIIFTHGLVDSVHYNSRFLPIIFLLLGLGGFVRRARRAEEHPVSIPLRWGLAGGGLLLVGLLLWGRTSLLAGWYANQGAVAQAKIELEDYQWPDRIPMKLRAAADLSEPTALFERALTLEPDNRTAQERLTLIRSASESTAQQ